MPLALADRRGMSVIDETPNTITESSHFHTMLAFEQRGVDPAIDAVEVGDQLIGVVTAHDRIASVVRLDQGSDEPRNLAVRRIGRRSEQVKCNRRRLAKKLGYVGGCGQARRTENDE